MRCDEIGGTNVSDSVARDNSLFLGVGYCDDYMANTEDRRLRVYVATTDITSPPNINLS